jgi:hypothetical protein
MGTSLPHYIPTSPYPYSPYTSCVVHTPRRSLPLLHGLPRRFLAHPTPQRRLRARLDQELHGMAVGAIYKLQVRAHGAPRLGCEHHFPGLELLLEFLELGRWKAAESARGRNKGGRRVAAFVEWDVDLGMGWTGLGSGSGSEWDIDDFGGCAIRTGHIPDWTVYLLDANSKIRNWACVSLACSAHVGFQDIPFDSSNSLSHHKYMSCTPTVEIFYAWLSKVEHVHGQQRCANIILTSNIASSIQFPTHLFRPSMYPSTTCTSTVSHNTNSYAKQTPLSKRNRPETKSQPIKITFVFLRNWVHACHSPSLCLETRDKEEPQPR